MTMEGALVSPGPVAERHPRGESRIDRPGPSKLVTLLAGLVQRILNKAERPNDARSAG